MDIEHLNNEARVEWDKLDLANGDKEDYHKKEIVDYITSPPIQNAPQVVSSTHKPIWKYMILLLFGGGFLYVVGAVITDMVLPSILIINPDMTAVSSNTFASLFNLFELIIILSVTTLGLGLLMSILRSDDDEEL